MLCGESIEEQIGRWAHKILLTCILPAMRPHRLSIPASLSELNLSRGYFANNAHMHFFFLNKKLISCGTLRASKVQSCALSHIFCDMFPRLKISQLGLVAIARKLSRVDQTTRPSRVSGIKMEMNIYLVCLIGKQKIPTLGLPAHSKQNRLSIWRETLANVLHVSPGTKPSFFNSFSETGCFHDNELLV